MVRVLLCRGWLTSTGFAAVPSRSSSPFHLYQRLVDPGAMGQLPPGFPTMVLVGRLAVDIFIVLSGYSLMITVARSVNGSLPGGAVQFAGRRARRILPPYYVALFASLIPILPALIGLRMPWRTTALPRPNLSNASIAAHVLLVHNLNPAWAIQINGPLWSLPTECQIYALFPTVLLPLWRRIGSWGMVATTFVAGLMLVRWMPSLMVASPWYAGLFAAGMTAAVATFRGGMSWWPMLAVVSAAGATLISIAFPPQVVAFDGLIGLAVAALLVGTARAPRWARAFSWPALVRLGVVSYSLYLIHVPLISLSESLASGLGHLADTRRILALPIVACVLCAATTMLFHRFVERPFMVGRPANDHRAAPSAM